MLRRNVVRQPLATRVDSHRRRALRALALGAALVVLCAGCDWPMLGYGPAHTSFNPTESAISVANVAGLVRRYPPSNTSGNCVVSGEGFPCPSPAVAKGSVYVGAGSDLVVRMRAPATCSGAAIPAVQFGRRRRSSTESSM